LIGKYLKRNSEITKIMANKLDNLKKFEKGESGNPNGRPKKYVSALKEQGYKNSEINDCILVMISMDLDELKEVWQNPRATILEKTIANALRKSLEKGSLYSIEVLLSRAVGKPKESIDHTTNGETMRDIQVTIVNANKGD
jgi:hypothetical protein